MRVFTTTEERTLLPPNSRLRNVKSIAAVATMIPIAVFHNLLVSVVFYFRRSAKFHFHWEHFSELSFKNIENSNTAFN